jgi:5'-3' exonuclease
MKYLLIDGNNLAVRAAFANEGLKNVDGIPTGVHFGVFQSLINLKQKFPDHKILIAWDSKSKRRMEESTDAVKQGIIPDAYKENRKKDEIPQPLQDFYKQSPFLQKGIGQVGLPQVRMIGFEADDVIASYVKALKASAEDVVVVTSDKDYYQILDSNVRLWDGMKMAEVTYDNWKLEWGIEPSQWVDVGALMGDNGDNIYGVPGWGEKTACKVIKKYGTWAKALDHFRDEYGKERITHPDLRDVDGGDVQFAYLQKKVSEKGRLVYPDISIDMPYTGVLLAFDQDKIDGSKSEIMALMFERRIKLAFSLKKMDDDIAELPEFDKTPINKTKLEEYFDFYDIKTLQNAMGLFE